MCLIMTAIRSGALSGLVVMREMRRPDQLLVAIAWGSALVTPGMLEVAQVLWGRILGSRASARRNCRRSRHRRIAAFTLNQSPSPNWTPSPAKDCPGPTCSARAAVDDASRAWQAGTAEVPRVTT